MTLPRAWEEEVARANADARQPVLFIPLSPSSSLGWGAWVAAFEAVGYAALTPSWPIDPGDPSTAKAVEPAAGDFGRIVHALNSRPAVVGYGFGGWVAQALARDGLSAATVAIVPASALGGLAPVDIPADQRGVMLIKAEPAGLDRAAAEHAIAFIQRFV